MEDDEPTHLSEESDGEEFAAERRPAAGKARAKAKGKGGGKGRNTRERGTKSTGKEPCLCCDQPRKNQKRFCEMHSRSADQMMYQAKAQSEEALRLVKKTLEDDKLARDEVLAFAKVNPPDQKYTRKKLIDWCSYLRRHFVTVSKKDKASEKPMTRRAFRLYAEGTLGLSESEWSSWWQQMLDDPHVDRDNEGFGGEMQLYIPLGRQRERARETGISNELQEGSRQMKNPTDKDLQVLKDHVHRQDVSMADAFIQQGMSAVGVKRSVDVADGASASEATEQAAKKKRKFNVDGDAPKQYGSMGAGLSKVQKACAKAQVSYDKVVKELKAVPEQEKNNDPALVSYIRMLQFRAQVFYKFQNSDEVVRLFNISPPPAPPAAPKGGDGDGDGDALESKDAEAAEPASPPSFYPAGSVEDAAPAPAPVTPSNNTADAAATPSSKGAGPVDAGADKASPPTTGKVASSTSSIGNSAAASSRALGAGPTLTEGYVKQASLKTFLTDHLSRKPFKGDVEHCRSIEELKTAREGVFEAQDSEGLAQIVEMWDASITIGQELTAALCQASSDVLSHLASQRRERVRREKAELSKRQADQLQRVREEAKKQADEIREKNKPAANKVLDSCFLLDFSKLDGVKEVKSLSAAPGEGDAAWNAPFVLEECEAVKLWLGESSVQRALTAYAGMYKKALTKAKDMSGRAQMRLEAKDAKEATVTLLDKILPSSVVDIGFFDAGKKFMDGVWVYGLLPHPDMTYIGFAPNSAACVRILALGEVKTLMIEPVSLAKATREAHGPAMENLDFLPGVAKWDADMVKNLTEAGVKMHSITHKAGQALYVPQSWMTVEVSCVGSNLLYGLRKSFMLGGAEPMAAYEEVLRLFRTSGRDVSKMDEILTKLKTTVG